jgi:hypothetical protein
MNDDLMKSAKAAALVIGSIYDWLDRVEDAGGTTSISGIAACHAMLKSLRKNGPRIEETVMAPLRKAMEEAK